jgi:hypothetical protein
MSLYTEIKKFETYFNSLRLHENLIILDLILPLNWEIEKVIGSRGNKIQLKVGSKTDKHKIISFYSVFDEKGTTKLEEEVKYIIKWNKDIEEKNILLNQKIIELKKIFGENNVDSLRELDINFNNAKLTLNGAEEFSTVVPERNPKGPEGNPTT